MNSSVWAHLFDTFSKTFSHLFDSIRLQRMPNPPSVSKTNWLAPVGTMRSSWCFVGNSRAKSHIRVHLYTWIHLLWAQFVKSLSSSFLLYESSVFCPRSDFTACSVENSYYMDKECTVHALFWIKALLLSQYVLSFEIMKSRFLCGCNEMLFLKALLVNVLINPWRVPLTPS